MAKVSKHLDSSQINAEKSCVETFQYVELEKGLEERSRLPLAAGLDAEACTQALAWALGLMRVGWQKSFDQALS